MFSMYISINPHPSIPDVRLLSVFGQRQNKIKATFSAVGFWHFALFIYLISQRRSFSLQVERVKLINIQQVRAITRYIKRELKLQILTAGVCVIAIVLRAQIKYFILCHDRFPFMHIFYIYTLSQSNWRDYRHSVDAGVAANGMKCHRATRIFYHAVDELDTRLGNLNVGLATRTHDYSAWKNKIQFRNFSKVLCSIVLRFTRRRIGLWVMDCVQTLCTILDMKRLFCHFGSTHSWFWFGDRNFIQLQIF